MHQLAVVLEAGQAQAHPLFYPDVIRPLLWRYSNAGVLTGRGAKPGAIRDDVA